MKKLISVLFVAIMLLLVSCTPSMRGTKGERQVSIVEVNKTGDLISQEPITFDIMVRVSSVKKEQTGHIYPYYEALAEKTNVRINWIEVPSGSHASKLILSLASNTYADAFWNFGLDSRESQLLASQGFIIPLSPYMEEGWTPNFVKLLNDRPNIKSMLNQNGEYYSMPGIQDYKYPYGESGVLAVNQDWLDRLGLDVPQNLDEFKMTLKAFKEQDANGNGDPNDEIPFSFTLKGNTWVYPWRLLLGSWGLMDDEHTHLMVENEKIVFVPAQEEFREAMNYYAELYKEGLLDEECYTQDLYAMQSKVKEDVIGIWLDQRFPNSEEDPEYKANYAPIPPLKGPEGKRLWSRVPEHPQLWVQITDKCKSPEALIRFADSLYEPMNSLQVNYGMIGDTLRDNNDGSYTPLLTSDELRNYTISGGSTLVSNELLNLVKRESNKKEENAAFMNSIYSPYGPEELFIYYPVPKDISKQLNSIQEDVDTYVSEKQASWIFGKSDINEEWVEYLLTLDKMDIQTYVDIFQDLRDKHYAQMK